MLITDPKIALRQNMRARFYRYAYYKAQILNQKLIYVKGNRSIH